MPPLWWLCAPQYVAKANYLFCLYMIGEKDRARDTTSIMHTVLALRHQSLGTQRTTTLQDRRQN